MNELADEHKQNKISFFLFITGTCLFVFAFQQIFFTTLLYYFKGAVFHNQLYFHLILQVPISCFLFRKFSSFSSGTIILSLGIQLLLLSLSVFWEMTFFDTSYDGQMYHQKGIMELANGFNPVLNNHTNKLIHYYPKGCWIPGALVFDALGNIETAKYVNVLYLASFFLIAFYTFLSIYNYKKWIDFLMIGLIVVAICFHPVAIMKMFNSYADGQLTCLMGITICYLMLTTKEPEYVMMAILSGLVMATTKFTGIVYLGVFFIGFLIWQYFSKRSIREILNKGSISIAVILALILLYHPIIENTLLEGHPFYPTNILGADNLLPDSMRDHNRFVNTFICIFSESNNVNNTTTVPELILPFTQKVFWPYEANIDVFAGLGPYFSGVCVLSILVFILVVLVEKKIRISLLFLSVILFISVFVNPGCWWFRWVPQFYWLILLPIVYACFSEKKAIAFAGVIILLLAVYNSITLFSVVYNANTIRTKQLHEQLSAIEKHTVRIDTCIFSSNLLRMDQYKIKYIVDSTIKGEKIDMMHAPCFYIQPVVPLKTDTLLSSALIVTEEEYYTLADKVKNRFPGFFYFQGETDKDVFVVINGKKGYSRVLQVGAGNFDLKIQAPDHDDTFLIFIWNPAKAKVKATHLNVLQSYYD